jgi:hypothetical protein
MHVCPGVQYPQMERVGQLRQLVLDDIVSEL